MAALFWDASIRFVSAAAAAAAVSFYGDFIPSDGSSFFLRTSSHHVAAWAHFVPIQSPEANSRPDLDRTEAFYPTIWSWI